MNNRNVQPRERSMAAKVTCASMDIEDSRVVGILQEYLTALDLDQACPSRWFGKKTLEMPLLAG